MNVKKLQELYKSAISSGKIIYTGKKSCQVNLDFRKYFNNLPEGEWKLFEDQECIFRKYIASKKINYGDFHCKGDIKYWIKLIIYLSGIFYRNKVFLHMRKINEPWSMEFIKFCCRILKAFPRDPDSNININVSSIAFLENQLQFINNTIRPYFSINKQINSNNPEKVPKERLTQLWITKRKKAIDIIKNNGYWPSSINAIISIERNEQYYASSNKYIAESSFLRPREERFFAVENLNVQRENFFQLEEIGKLITSAPNGKAGGIDGVSYEDLKDSYSELGHVLVNIMNVMLINHRISRYWKHSIIKRIPKKNFCDGDLSTLRDISLLPVCYKIFSKAICNRIMQLVSHKIEFWQRAFLNKRDRQELIFTLKSKIDDFHHLSTKMHLVFIDFADAFGSVKHQFIFETLQYFEIPKMYCCLIEDLYRYSTFNVLCGNDLTEVFYIVRGTKTGDPLSALIFILAIDRVCNPMVNEAMNNFGLENERRFNSIPIQAFADDIVISSEKIDAINSMISISEPLMENAGLEVKESKCAVFYGRRSGNNWYKGKNDSIPDIVIQSKHLPVFKRDECYKYLGKSLSLSGEDPLQIKEISTLYMSLVDKIKSSALPLSLKCSAFNNMALAKILHHFYNSRFSEIILEQMDKHLVAAVRELFGFYKSTTQLAIFLPREKGGLGIKKLSFIYYSTRIAYIVKMLNHRIDQFKIVARNSLALDMKKRNVNFTNSSENFLGYEVNQNGFLKNNSSFGGQSDWPELLRYARKVDVSIKFENNFAIVIINNEKFHEPHNMQKLLYGHCIETLSRKAASLTVQGCFFNLSNINSKCSNSILYNWKIDDKLMMFLMKARLSILPTNYTLFLWNRDHDANCPFGCQHTESMAHLLNGCIKTFGNFYSRRHNRIVEKIATYLRNCRCRYRIYQEKQSESIFTPLRIELLDIQHRRPDIHLVDEVSKSCILIEISVCYDIYLDYANQAKKERYSPLVDCLKKNGYDTKLITLCFGSLGSVRNNVWNDLKGFTDDKIYLKSIIKSCSISNIIGSNYIWRHRVKKLFS